jgi:hypothetical protein
MSKCAGVNEPNNRNNNSVGIYGCFFLSLRAIAWQSRTLQAAILRAIASYLAMTQRGLWVNMGVLKVLFSRVLRYLPQLQALIQRYEIGLIVWLYIIL